MDTDLIEILSRTLISAGLIALMLRGQLSGAYGGFYVTIIMGIDLAAAFEALRESQTDKDTTYQDQ